MGILDEAIREHLALKRQQGAEESELKGLEDEAFGPAERPDATNSEAEAETQVISPGSSVTSPAGEGDQLDKVFEATRQREADAAAEGAPGSETLESKPEAETPADPEPTFAEHPVPEQPAPSPEAEAGPESTDAATVESPEAKPAEPQVAAEPPEPADSGDAGDLLEAERQHLANHPTEHYDVDAAIAEEDEIDILSESSLSDELDRALDSGEVDAAGGETVGYSVPDEAGPPEAEPTGSEADEPESAESEIEEDSAELLNEDAATEDQPADDESEEDEPGTGEEEAGEEEGDSADFFDQDDVLEATPDFLEETPEHDQLWFEQKEPKDFDFGD